jgi:hypothetical protein
MSTPLPPTAFRYVDTDVPEGQTLVAWRRAHAAPRRPRGRVRRHLHLPAVRARS